MKPEQTGSGKGAAFLNFLLHVIEHGHPGRELRLTVAVFNRRAIRLYDKAGFVRTAEFPGEYAAFQVMLKKNP